MTPVTLGKQLTHDLECLGRENVLVVTPYNAQVRCLSAVLPAGTRVGTVDKVQGQEAPAVIFSMATSSGDTWSEASASCSRATA